MKKPEGVVRTASGISAKDAEDWPQVLSVRMDTVKTESSIEVNFFVGMPEDFKEFMEGRSLDFRRKMAEHLIYMVSDTIERGFKLTPQ